MPIYPFGYAVIGVMHVGTVLGSLRFQLIEITPEIAAEQILETMPTGLLVADNQRQVRLANEAAARLLGRPLGDLLNHPLETVAVDAGLRGALEAAASSTPAPGEVRFSAADGATRTVAVSSAGVPHRSGKQVARLWLLHDLTEQRNAEAEQQRLEGWMRQTRKMESLGVMAGGIAHDFNNILMAIMGSAEIAAINSGDGLLVQQEMQTILSSAEHAAALTGQLLTYAGRDTPVETPIDLNALALGMADLLHSAISKNASLEMDLCSRRPMILGDGGQLRQVILNLVTNASEALGDAAGTITLRTLDAGSGQERRAVLEVTDTGVGMDPEALSRVFEPFFTTKFTGRGLGLATVIRIVQGHRGVVNVHSTPGEGTRFEVSFPALAHGQEMAGVVPDVSHECAGSGLVLLADDETSVRGVVRAALIRIGFAVVECADGAAAVEAFRQRPTSFTAVVMDVTMPGMGGVEAVKQIRLTAPDIPVVFISGYSAAAGSAALSDARTVFLPKPFKLPQLAATLRDVIAGGV